MKADFRKLIPLFFLLSVALFCDESDEIIWYGGNLVGEAILTDKIRTRMNDFEDSYSFGFSEMESELTITGNGETYSLIHKAGRFTENGEGFVWNYTELKDFRINDGQFEKDGWKGRFVYYYYQPENYDLGTMEAIYQYKGLIIYSSPISIENELGINDCTIAGDYPDSHYRLLENNDLAGKSKDELKIMRNEIFARYGYIFRPGGEMDTHFRNQIWYTSRFRNVDRFMNNKEKNNIHFILSHE